MEDILFTIVIPTYNRAAFIKKTIESFQKQTYQNFEIIVVDDGSKDNTEEVMKTITDARVQYHKKANEERGVARNYGANLAKGAYINFFDSDDIAYPNHLESALAVIHKFSDPEVFHLGYDIKTPEGKLLEEYKSFDGNVEAYAIRKKAVSINALFVRTDVVKSLPFSTNRLLSASEDALFLCQLCARYTLHYDNTITSTIIEHDSRSMITASEQQLLNRRKYFLEGLQNDKPFMEKYASHAKDIAAEMSYLLCLSSLATKDNDKAIKYFKEYLAGPSTSVFGRRTLSFFKKRFENLVKK